MPVELNYNSKNNPPNGNGWEWIEYQKCWRRFYDGRKRRKKNKQRKTMKFKNKQSNPVVSPYQVVLISLLILFVVLILLNKNQ